MANRIMGITVEIGGDTTKLQTALKGVNGKKDSTALSKCLITVFYRTQARCLQKLQGFMLRQNLKNTV